jgi:hypothetical protein
MPGSKVSIFRLLQPENDLEAQLLEHPDFLEGLFWGVPRRGHPEGEVYKHVREVLDNIDQLDVNDNEREKLRLIAFVHDTFKYKEDRSLPRDWSKHHAVHARRFLEDYVDNEEVLDIIELHDEVFHCWSWVFMCGDIETGEKKLRALIDRLGNNLNLYYLFFRCDTLTGNKILSPLWWFEEKIKEFAPKTIDLKT